MIYSSQATMTSILEQFERASSQPAPLFQRQGIPFSPPHPLTHCVVSNGHLLLAMGNKTLLKIDQSSPSALPEELDLSKLAFQAVVYR